MEKTMINKQAIENTIALFNRQAKQSFQYGSQKNIDAVTKALTVADDEQELRTYIIEACRLQQDGYTDLVKVCDYFIGYKSAIGDVLKSHEVRPMSKEEKAMTQGMALLSQTIAEVMGKADLSKVEDTIAKRIENQVTQFIMENYGPIQRATSIDISGKTVKIKGVTHAKFETVLKYVAMNEPVYLAGPAGTGKNVLCKQIAKALDLDFYFTNAVTQEYQIKGFTDAMGKYQPTQFYEAFTKGGLFMLDEMDGSIPEALIILNAAIANRYFDFPAPIGRVEAHENFRIIAAGNTVGSGADYDYVGRNQLDAASMNRFGIVRIDYDTRIEEACARGNADLLEFCRRFRNATKEAGIRTVVSYRDIERMAKLDALLDTKELIQSALIKGIDKEDMHIIKDKMSGCGKYSAAFLALL